MKKFEQLLIDLGFNQDASVAAQEAFLRHMQRVARFDHLKLVPSQDKGLTEMTQLSFDAEILGQQQKTK